MQRFVALVAFLLFAFPVGMSFSGCRTAVDEYCNNAGYGPKLSQITTVTLSGATTGISLAYGQKTTAGTVTAENCRGTTLGAGTPTYGSSNLNLVDINPSTGALCAGTWNRLSAGGIPDYTICTPPTAAVVASLSTTVAQITASLGGVASNPVNVYVHPAIAAITIPTPTQCYSQNVVGDGLNGDPAPFTSGTIALDSTGTQIPSQDLGTVTFAASTPSIVTVNNVLSGSTSTVNGSWTANLPGSTVITATLSQATSSAGYFYTCPPASIGLALNGATTGTVSSGNPQNLTTAITDTNGTTITGLTLDYESTQPQQIAVSTAGAISSTYPTTAAITAICQPGTCNPAPISQIGTFGTGMPVVSNRFTATSTGASSTQFWTASPDSQYFDSFDLTLGTSGSAVKLPYVPNSMVMDPTGTDLYFGSYRELMIYATATNTLGKADVSVPGVVLAVSPDNSTVLINDQVRDVLYLYTVSTGTNTSLGGLATHAVFSPDSKNVYIIGPNAVYVHNSTTGWSTYPSSNPIAGPTGVCDAADLNNNASPQFCSPSVALSVPAVSPFFTGTPATTNTTARSFCPNGTGSSIVYYPLADTISTETDQLAATNDGAHIIGANATGVVDIQNSNASATNRDIVPSGACPAVTGDALTLSTTAGQVAFESGFAPSYIDQVVASPNSTQAFVTYTLANATGVLPLYVPSVTAGSAGTLSYVQLASGAEDPIAGVFSPDAEYFFVSTTGDNLIHQLSTTTLQEVQTLNPLLPNQTGDGTYVPAQFVAARPRATN